MIRIAATVIRTTVKKSKCVYSIGYLPNRPTAPKFDQRINKPVRFFFTSSSNPSQIPLLQEVQGKIFQVIKTAKPVLARKSLDRNSTFQSLGFDSLDTTQLIIRMEDFFGQDLTDEEARSIETIGMAIDIFFRKLNARVMNKLVSREDFTPRKF